MESINDKKRNFLRARCEEIPLFRWILNPFIKFSCYGSIKFLIILTYHCDVSYMGMIIKDCLSVSCTCMNTSENNQRRPGDVRMCDLQFQFIDVHVYLTNLVLMVTKRTRYSFSHTLPQLFQSDFKIITKMEMQQLFTQKYP